MAIRLFEPTDLIPVDSIPLLVYGPPGTGKTTVAQMTTNPVTLDFDRGIRRTQFRGPAIDVDSWSDVLALGRQAMDGQPAGIPESIAERFRNAETLVIDTGGRALDTMIPEIIRESGKNSYQGNLSPQGYGILGNRFTTWMKQVASWRKQVVMVCHQAEFENAAGERAFAPDFPGKMAAKEVYKTFDLIGRLYVQNGRRFVDFSPSEMQVAKNSGNLPLIEVPDFRQKPDPRFLAGVIERAKAEIGKTVEQSARVAKEVEDWRSAIAKGPDLDTFNAYSADILVLTGTAPHRNQVWALLKEYGEGKGWVLNRHTKSWEVPPVTTPGGVK